MSIAIYGLAVQTIGIGIAFLIGAVVCQESGESSGVVRSPRTTPHSRGCSS